LKKTAIAIDEADSTHYVVFRFRTVTGAVEEVSVSADAADHKHSLRSALVKRGLQVPSDAKEADSLFARAIVQDTSNVWRYTAQAGWQRDVGVFLVGDQVIGETAVQYKTHPSRNQQGTARPAKRGTLEDWQKLVGTPAACSSVVMTAIASAFAAPLLEPAGHENFLVNVYGPSKAGKSTALIAATSVYGIGKEQDLPNWNTTALGAQEMARDFNDIVLPMNEVELINGPNKSAYDTVIRPLIYAYAQGRNRTVSSRAQRVDTGPAQTWRGILVSTAEESFDQLALLGGTKRDAGERARCIEIPATTGRRTTIVDRFPNDVERSERNVWAARLLAGLRAACEAQHGSAIGPFISYVMAMKRVALVEFIAHHTNAFLARGQRGRTLAGGRSRRTQRRADLCLRCACDQGEGPAMESKGTSQSCAEMLPHRPGRSWHHGSAADRQEEAAKAARLEPHPRWQALCDGHSW
jgi:hypothetical protein